jgi:hypothetical protein
MIGAIYRKLYHRFLARKILRRSPTINNRPTFIKLAEDKIIEPDHTDNEWGGETCVEKVQRSLKAMGMSNNSLRAISWVDTAVSVPAF